MIDTCEKYVLELLKEEQIKNDKHMDIIIQKQKLIDELRGIVKSKELDIDNLKKYIKENEEKWKANN